MENGEATVKLVPPGEELTTPIADLPGQKAYPFITYSWLLLNQRYPDPARVSTPGKKGRFSPTNSNVNNPPIKN